jgi:hypothetical protein
MVSSTRRLIGLVLVVAAAVAAVWSAFLTWYGARDGTDIRIQDLFNGLTFQKANTFGSLLIPLAISAVLVLAGIVVWWRWLWGLGGLVAIATAILWGVRQAQTGDGLHSGLMGNGPATAACAGAAMLLAAVIATARAKKTSQQPADRLSPEWTPATSTQVGQPEASSEPRIDEHTPQSYQQQ